MRWLALTLFSLTACKPTPELVAQEAELARQLAALEDLEAHAEERRAELNALQEELDGYRVDLAGLRALAGPGATVDDDVVKITLTLPGATPERARDVFKALFEKHPTLGVLTFAVSERNAVLEAATCITRPTPARTLTPIVSAPSFCSRACKDLAARAVKEREDIEALRVRLGPLTTLPDVRESAAASRAISKMTPPTKPSLALLDRLVLAQWLTAGSVTFLMDGPLAQLHVDPMPMVGKNKVTVAECNQRFSGLAACEEKLDLLVITELSAPAQAP